MPKPTFQFPLFNSFPPEIHSLILEICPDNDRICLSLTNKTFYSLASTIKKPVCLSNKSHRLSDCSEGDASPDKPWDYWHRLRCHELCHANLTALCNRQGLPAPPLKKCRTRKWDAHCECFSGPALHQTLRSWVPKDRRYCRSCLKFTFRRGKDKARCPRCRPKGRRPLNRLWTHHSRKGAFARDLWKKWYNNAAMDRFEARLGRPNTRHENKRYALRALEPMDVDTSDMR